MEHILILIQMVWCDVVFLHSEMHLSRYNKSMQSQALTNMSVGICIMVYHAHCSVTRRNVRVGVLMLWILLRYDIFFLLHGNFFHLFWFSIRIDCGECFK